MDDEFRKDLESLINRHSRENASDTPDFILAKYIGSCLDAYDAAVCERERWYSRSCGNGTAISQALTL